MLKKIFAFSLITFHVFTQAAGAMEFQPVMAQPIPALAVQVPSDILKNERPIRSASAFSFFKISDSVVNQPLAFGQGLRFFSGVKSNITLANSSSWLLTTASPPLFSSSSSRSLINDVPLVEQNGFASKSLSRFWQSQSLLGVHSGSVSKFSETAVMNDGDEVIEERNATGGLVADYVYGPGIDEVLTMTRGANTYYYFYDALGSVRQITNAAGTISETYDYDVFGKPLNTSTLGNPVMFTGRWFDSESGNFYYRARYYQPTLGRFLQKDPIGYLGGTNLYSYVKNSPANYLDPKGLWEIKSRPLENGAAAYIAETWLYTDDTKLGMHWHIFFDDGSNVGYLGDNRGANLPKIGPDRLENLGKYNQQPIYKGTDDFLMREAVLRTKYIWEQEYLNGQRYHHAIFDNQRNFDCQDFVWTVLQQYYRLKRERLNAVLSN